MLGPVWGFSYLGKLLLPTRLEGLNPLLRGGRKELPHNCAQEESIMSPMFS